MHRMVCQPITGENLMKTDDRQMAKRGTENAKHEQEDAAARDHPRQRKAGSAQARAKARKQKDKKSGA